MDDTEMGSDGLKVCEYVKSLQQFAFAKPNYPYGHMGATILDASLQAGLKYDLVVEPRVRKLMRCYPHFVTTSEFSALLKIVPLNQIAEWKHEEKLSRIQAVLNLFLKENVETEGDLFEWIKSEDNQRKLKECHGVGDKTLDYYKLLAGHSTLAIDRHLYAFLAEAAVKIQDGEYSRAQDILAVAARLLDIEQRVLDYSIWKYMSDKSSKKQRFGGHCLSSGAQTRCAPAS